MSETAEKFAIGQLLYFGVGASFVGRMEIVRQTFPPHNPDEGAWIDYVRERVATLLPVVAAGRRVIAVDIQADRGPDGEQPYVLEVTVEI